MSSDISELIQSLRGNDAASRLAAAERLSQLGPAAQAAAVPLVEACHTSDDALREYVAATLEEMGPPMPLDAGRLATLLAHASPDVAYWAATLLGRLQDHAAPAVAPLAEALARRAEISVKERAAWALGQIGPAAADARPALEQAAASPNSRLARLAKEALDGLP